MAQRLVARRARSKPSISSRQSSIRRWLILVVIGPTKSRRTFSSAITEAIGWLRGLRYLLLDESGGVAGSRKNISPQRLRAHRVEESRHGFFSVSLCHCG